MKKLGISSIVAGALTAAVVGFAAPANAGVDHNSWIDQISPTVSVPHVDTTVHQSH